MSNELFENVLGIHEQIDAYLPLRSRGEGFPAIFVRTWPYYVSLRYVQGKPTNQRFQRSSAYTSAGRWHLISGRHRSVSRLTYLPRISILVLIADLQQNSLSSPGIPRGTDSLQLPQCTDRSSVRLAHGVEMAASSS
jgi:hypothetical protein